MWIDTKTVESLQSNNMNTFSESDALADPETRQGLKKCSNQPTYPQSGVSSEPFGGLDIVKEMNKDNDALTESLGIEADTELSLDNLLYSLTHKSKQMIFMKCNQSGPKHVFHQKSLNYHNPNQRKWFKS